VNSFGVYFEGITLSDVIDIIVVSFIVYRFLLIVHGTRALQMLVGLLTVSLLYVFSLRYEMVSLNWLLNNFFDYFFLILIILFQDEIRTALVAFGETKIFGKQNKIKTSRLIEELAEATFALSHEKTGALMVIENQQGLLNFIETGTRLESRIFSDVIYSLFQESSPLHDGALIIKNEKIMSAGCFLPLSKNIEIDRQYGTRHRAALGVSEVSDAVVITVSEERGEVSICYDGKFINANDKILFRKTLNTLLQKDQVDPENLIRSESV
jgi:diadenylate cyclase